MTPLQRVPLTGDYWTSLGNHNYLGVTVPYIDEQWALHSHALTVMKTEERHYVETFVLHLTLTGTFGTEHRLVMLLPDKRKQMFLLLSQKLPILML